MLRETEVIPEVLSQIKPAFKKHNNHCSGVLSSLLTLVNSITSMIVMLMPIAINLMGRPSSEFGGATPETTRQTTHTPPVEPARVYRVCGFNNSAGRALSRGTSGCVSISRLVQKVIMCAHGWRRISDHGALRFTQASTESMNALSTFLATGPLALVPACMPTTRYRPFRNTHTGDPLFPVSDQLV